MPPENEPPQQKPPMQDFLDTVNDQNTQDQQAQQEQAKLDAITTVGNQVTDAIAKSTKITTKTFTDTESTLGRAIGTIKQFTELATEMTKVADIIKSQAIDPLQGKFIEAFDKV